MEVVDTEAQERQGVEVPAEAPAEGQRLVEADVVVGARSDALVVELEIVALGQPDSGEDVGEPFRRGGTAAEDGESDHDGGGEPQSPSRGGHPTTAIRRLVKPRGRDDQRELAPHRARLEMGPQGRGGTPQYARTVESTNQQSGFESLGFLTV